MATYHLRIKNDTKPSGKKVSAKRHAEYILREEGSAHADYINREGAQSNKDDCVFKNSQLPKWAKGSPQKFFSAATRYEDKGNRRYKEIELSLPNELTLEQNRKIVDEFIANHLSKHYYAYAIHDKAGELSGERHPHAHIMFSERLIDDVERISERPACKYFRKAAKPLKGEQIASFERRRQHGAPKDPKWHDRNYLYELREDFARIQNEVLAENGFSIYVDHRTLKAQEETAEKAGDEFLSQLYKRMPESYVGILPIQEETESSRAVKRYRRNVQSKQHALFQADIQQKMAEEFETKLLVRRAEHAGLALLNSEAYKSANMEDETLRFLNQEIISRLARIKEVKRYFVGVDRARELAEGQYLTSADRKFILDYRNVQGQECNLERLLRELTELPETYKESQEEFLAIKRVMDFNNRQWTFSGEKLREQYYIAKEKIHLEETERKLAETKSRLEKEIVRLETLCQTVEAQEKIALIAVGILRKNLKIAQEYEAAKKLLSNLWDTMQETKKRFNALDSGYWRLKKNYVYRVIQSGNDSTKTASLEKSDLVGIIADALLAEPYAVQLVARLDSNFLEMEKNWEMMSELDKDEFIRKKIIREL